VAGGLGAHAVVQEAAEREAATLFRQTLAQRRCPPPAAAAPPLRMSRSGEGDPEQEDDRAVSQSPRYPIPMPIRLPAEVERFYWYWM
jgi:hypothetical protein